MCMLCKDNSYKENVTTHVVTYGSCIIVIKNVPCLECELCGEKYFTDEVAEKLEKNVNSVKTLMQEISIVAAFCHF